MLVKVEGATVVVEIDAGLGAVHDAYPVVEVLVVAEAAPAQPTHPATLSLLNLIGAYPKLHVNPSHKRLLLESTLHALISPSPIVKSTALLKLALVAHD